jgi:serine/threonine protein kinase
MKQPCANLPYVLNSTQKPDNVGFDAAGEVKIFDFGLAKRLDPEDKTDTELYLLTGNTGSLRYMAPEGAFSVLCV